MVPDTADNATMSDAMAADKPESWFTKKLRRLIGKAHVEIDAEAELPRGSVSVYLHRNTVPQPFNALKLARALGVDIEWLIDEDDHSLEPRPAEPTLSRAPDIQLLNEGRSRYKASMNSLYTALEKAKATPWEQVAIWMLSNQDRTDPPQPIREVVAFVEAIDDLVYDVRRYKTYLIGGPFVREVDVESGTSAVVLHPDELLKTSDQLATEHPGLSALCEYIRHAKESYLEERKRRPGWDRRDDFIVSEFWSRRAPHLLARLVNHPTVAGNKKYDVLRKLLTRDGYLDQEGKPVDVNSIDLPKVNSDSESKPTRSRKKQEK